MESGCVEWLPMGLRATGRFCWYGKWSPQWSAVRGSNRTATALGRHRLGQHPSGARPCFRRHPPTREVTTREVEDLLRSVASTGVAPRHGEQVASNRLRDLQLRDVEI